MIGLTALVILGFAAYRATRIAVHDTITDWPRNAAFDWHANRPESRTRTALITLISCTYCMGWWISGATLATYLLATGTWTGTSPWVHAIEWVAVAGLQALLNTGDDTASNASEALATYTEQQATTGAPVDEK